MAIGFKFPIKNADETVSTTTENFFVSDGSTSPTSGALFTCGRNSYGSLGLGDKILRSTPVQVGALTNWKQTASHQTLAGAVKTDGTLWTFGYNYFGQLGQGDTTSVYSSPTQVGNLTNWKQLSTGFYHMVGVKTDGTMWSWGYNVYGQLGKSKIGRAHV